MDFFMKLPQNKKEFAIFLAIVSVLSVNIIAPLITCFEVGFHFTTWIHTLKVIPFIWIAVIILVLITEKPAKWLTNKFVAKDDSFSAHIIIHILCSVLFMSFFLTIIGSWIGMRAITLEPLRLFFYKWPRNFAISFFVEAVIAQPIARSVMHFLHQNQALELERITE